MVAFLRAHADVAMVYADYLAIDDAGKPLTTFRVCDDNTLASSADDTLALPEGADAASVKRVQEQLGTAAAGERVEHAMASLAQTLVQARQPAR